MSMNQSQFQSLENNRLLPYSQTNDNSVEQQMSKTYIEAHSIKSSAMNVLASKKMLIRSSIVATKQDGEESILVSLDVAVAADADCSEGYLKDLAIASLASSAFERLDTLSTAWPRMSSNPLPVFSLLDAILENDIGMMLKDFGMMTKWYAAYFGKDAVSLAKFWRCFFYALCHAEHHRFDTRLIGQQVTADQQDKLLFSTSATKYLKCYLTLQLSSILGQEFEPNKCRYLERSFGDHVTLVADATVTLSDQLCEREVNFFNVLCSIPRIHQSQYSRDAFISASYGHPILWLLMKESNQQVATMSELDRQIIVACSLRYLLLNDYKIRNMDAIKMNYSHEENGQINLDALIRRIEFTFYKLEHLNRPDSSLDRHVRHLLMESETAYVDSEVLKLKSDVENITAAPLNNSSHYQLRADHTVGDFLTNAHFYLCATFLRSFLSKEIRSQLFDASITLDCQCFGKNENLIATKMAMEMFTQSSRDHQN